MTDWWGAYVGRAFEDGGRGPVTFDCWGLVRAVYRDRLGLDLPLHEGVRAADHRSVAQAMQDSARRAEWAEVAEPRAFDVMLARRDPHSRWPGHVGVMIDGARVLHVWAGRNVHVARLVDPALAPLVVGFYRHGGAA